MAPPRPGIAGLDVRVLRPDALLLAAEAQTATARTHAGQGHTAHARTAAAWGLTNDQIAPKLVISVRTAESHLYHVFRKLGIHDHDELRALLNASTPA